MARTVIEEKSAHPVRFTFADADGVVVSPNSVHWRLDCVTTGTPILEWQTISPSSVVDFIVPASANAIINEANDSETKCVTCQANYDTDGQINGFVEYDVRNSAFYA